MNQSLITRNILNIEKCILKLEDQIKDIEKREHSRGIINIKNPFNLDNTFYGGNEDNNIINLNPEIINNAGTLFLCLESFSELDKIVKINNINELDTSNVVAMYRTFDSCKALTALDLSKWNVSNVVNMDWMFRNCSSLKELDLSNWDISNVTSMSGMFDNCYALTTVKIGFDNQPTFEKLQQYLPGIRWSYINDTIIKSS